MSGQTHKKWHKPYPFEEPTHRMPGSHEEAWEDMVDDGVYLAQANLGQIVGYAQRAHEMVDGLEDMPDWVEDKISKARAMLGTVVHFLEEFEDVFDEPYDEEEENP